MFLVFYYWNVSLTIQIWMFLVFYYWNVFFTIQIWMFLVFYYWNVFLTIQIWMFLVFHYLLTLVLTLTLTDLQLAVTNMVHLAGDPTVHSH